MFVADPDDSRVEVIVEASWQDGGGHTCPLGQYVERFLGGPLDLLVLRDEPLSQESLGGNRQQIGVIPSFLGFTLCPVGVGV